MRILEGPKLSKCQNFNWNTKIGRREAANTLIADCPKGKIVTVKLLMYTPQKTRMSKIRLNKSSKPRNLIKIRNSIYWLGSRRLMIWQIHYYYFCSFVHRVIAHLLFWLWLQSSLNSNKRFWGYSLILDLFPEVIMTENVETKGYHKFQEMGLKHFLLVVNYKSWILFCVKRSHFPVPKCLTFHTQS